MLYLIIGIGIGLMVLERITPDQKLPRVPGWWGRVIIINVLQLGVVTLAGITWDQWLQRASLFHLADHVPPAVGGFLTYFLVTFIFYWWHRWRHDIEFLWLTMHQIHHSPRRIETITSFFKHPVEIICNSLIIGMVGYTLLGIDIAAGAWCTLYTAVAEYFYHMNIRTPHWVGYFLQRPEMHRLHHQKDRHYDNFSDLPLWDKLFGTYQNPKTNSCQCGFLPERESKFWDMLVFKNVNPKKQEA